MSASDDTFAERLRDALKGEAVNSFAERSGVGATTLRKYLAGSEPGLHNLIAIATAANVDIRWLATGKPTPVVAIEPSYRDDFQLIPRLDISASAGPGLINYPDHEQVEMLAFREEWLRRRGINPRSAAILTASGDSMEPLIRDGDILLVDTSITQVRDAGIYVILVNDRLMVKRVHIGRADGAIVLISDNPIYPQELIQARDLPTFTFAGRVMWFGRSI